MTATALTVRKIPFDLSSALGLPDQFYTFWDHEHASSLLGLGYSYFLEFIELFYNSIRLGSIQEIQSSRVTDSERVFHIQEIQHSKYHNTLNAFLAPGRSRPVGTHPRVYDFLLPIYERRYAGIVKDVEAAAKDTTRANPAVCKALEILALFESQTCASSIVFFDTLFDGGRAKYAIKNSGNLGVLYLFGYHFAEELEHCGVAVDLYEDVAGRPFWEKGRVCGSEYGLDEEALVAALAIASNLGVSVTEAELLDSSFYRLTMKKKNELLVGGFHPDNAEVASLRRHYVEHWDHEWGPAIERAIQFQKEQ
jgi:predicted metal-dependent hydrolase